MDHGQPLAAKDGAHEHVGEVLRLGLPRPRDGRGWSQRNPVLSLVHGFLFSKGKTGITHADIVSGSRW